MRLNFSYVKPYYTNVSVQNANNDEVHSDCLSNDELNDIASSLLIHLKYTLDKDEYQNLLDYVAKC